MIWIILYLYLCGMCVAAMYVDEIVAPVKWIAWSFIFLWPLLPVYMIIGVWKGRKS